MEIAVSNRGELLRIDCDTKFEKIRSESSAENLIYN